MRRMIPRCAGAGKDSPSSRIPAGPGAATGRIAFNAEHAVSMAKDHPEAVRVEGDEVDPQDRVSDRNSKGFWERRGYSDTAEPWFNDRYS